MAAALRQHASPNPPHPRAVAAAAGRVVRLAPVWRRRAHALIDEHTTRSHHRDHLHAYVDALAVRAYGDGTATLTRAAAAELLGCTERTVSNLRAWLDRHGLLTTLEGGSTAATRRDVPDTGNRCAVYVLTAVEAPALEAVTDPVRPPRELLSPTRKTGTFTPPLSRKGERKSPLRQNQKTNHARAREAPTAPALGEPGRRLRRDGSRSAGQRRSDELRLALAVLDRLGALAEHEQAPHLDRLVAGVGAPFVRSLLRAAGLLALDVEAIVWALGHAPDGTVHAAEATPEHPVAVLRWRLGLWAPLVARYGPQAPFVDLQAHRATLDALQARRNAQALERELAADEDASGRVAVQELLAARRRARLDENQAGSRSVTPVPGRLRA